MSVAAALMEVISSWVRELGPIGIFGGVMLETLVAIIPSPLVPMAAGFSLIPPNSPPYTVFLISATYIGLVGSLAATLGSLLHYTLGYYGGKPLIRSLGSKVGIGESEVERAAKWIESKGIAAFLLARILPIIPLSPVSVGAGLIRMDLPKFTLLTLLGTLPRYLVLGMAGFYAGEAYRHLAHALDAAENAVVLMLLAGLALYLLVRRLRRGMRI